MDCETCYYYDYDETYGDYICLMEIDQDDMARICMEAKGRCPYYRQGDEYTLARKQ